MRNEHHDTVKLWKRELKYDYTGLQDDIDNNTNSYSDKIEDLVSEHKRF